jgi:hypothetical protein
MIDLPDHGYASFSLHWIDPGGVAEGALGGPAQNIDRLGLRYAITFNLNPLPTANDARLFQARLERGARDDVSYPWPLDRAAGVAGAPVVNGVSAPGLTIPLRGLLPGYAFREGQPVAVISGGLGFAHRVSAPIVVDGAGHVVLPVFPLTRRTFADGDVVEVQRPRLRGILQWDGADQGAAANRGFSFSIAERQ